MKILHWAIILIAIILPVSIVCRMNINSRFQALKDEVRINNAIDIATYDAVDQILTVDKMIAADWDYSLQFEDVIDVTPELAQESINTFFHSMAINYNIPYKTSDTTWLDDYSYESYIKNYFSSYVPAVLVIAYDGFYIYSEELHTNDSGSYYGYTLSPKIPFTCKYTTNAGEFIVGYTLKNDIYLIYKDKCYSGRIKYNSLAEIEHEFIEMGFDNSSIYQTVDDVAAVTNDISMILYKLKGNSSLELPSCIFPENRTVSNFVEDFSHDFNDEVKAGPFHSERRRVIIEKISETLSQEINEHNSYANIIGSTYHFTLPDITNDEWYNSIDDISVMAFVQGIPVGTTDGQYFNSYALGGAQIVKRNYFYGKNGLYHRSDCEIMNDKVYEEILISEEDANFKGYVSCMLCN